MKLKKRETSEMKTIKCNGMNGRLVKRPQPLWNDTHENLKISCPFSWKLFTSWKEMEWEKKE